MVKPYSSKRKLFNQDQKENEPNSISSNKQEAKTQDTQHKIVKEKSHIRRGSLISDDCRKFKDEQSNKSFMCEDVCSPGLPRPTMPMSERQQIAFLKQMSSPSTPASQDYLEKNLNTPPTCRSTSKRNDRGETPLHVAAIKGDDKKVFELIEQGCDVNETDYAGWAPLHEACNRGFLNIVQLLINAGANVNAKGLDNDTPLHDACINNHLQIVKLLLNSGADSLAINRRGQSPKDICRSAKILDLIEKNIAREPLKPEKNSPDFEGFSNSPNKYYKQTLLALNMSRRTPPANKMEDKSPPGSVVSTTSSSSSSNTSTTTTSRPDSPRVGSRLPQTNRTEKNQRSSDLHAPENEDIYEFKCSKDELPGDTEEKTDSTKSDAASVPESRPEKRTREQETEDEERKKKRKEEVVEKNTKSSSRSTTSASKPPTPTADENTNPDAPISDQKSPASSPKPVEMSSDNEDSKAEPGAPKVPPLKIVLASTGEQETNLQTGKNNNSRHLSYIISSNDDKDGTGEVKDETMIKQEDLSNLNASSDSISSPTTTSCFTSVATSTNSSTKSNCSSNNSSTSNMASGEKGGIRVTRSQRGGTFSEENVSVKIEPKVEEETSNMTDVVPPRKRKLKKVPELQEPPAPVPEVQPSVTNCYEMFLKLRSQVEQRRKLLVPVQPKPPPQGFKGYLMNKCSYALVDRNNGTLPPLKAPKSLPQPLIDLFNEQEQARRTLRLEHQIEREKLVLSVEQEILRVHGRAARALANQSAPFSVCSILKDEEVYNIITPEQEEKNRNARSRYNGRLFLSWLQDVDDKWEKIKEAMVLRHHNEAESLHAVQKMGWEWKLKELNLIDGNSPPSIPPDHVPMVIVTDFDLLPEGGP